MVFALLVVGAVPLGGQFRTEEPLRPDLFVLRGFGFDHAPETGARALAMGGAYVAISGDLATALWNPAGLARLERPEATVLYDQTELEVREGPLRFLFESHFTDAVRTRVNREELLLLAQDESGRQSEIGHLAAGWPIVLGKDRVLAMAVVARRGPEPVSGSRLRAFGFTSNLEEVLFGELSTELVESTVSELSVTSVSGGSEIFGLTLAMEPIRRLRLGVSVNYLTWDTTDVTLYSLDEPGTVNGQAFETAFTRPRRRSLSFSDWQLDVGLQLDLGSRWTLGAVYRGGFTTDYDLTDSVEVEHSFFDYSRPSSVDTCGRLEWPDGWAGGVAFRPIPALTLALDLTRTNWSQAEMSDFVEPGFRQRFSPTSFSPFAIRWVDPRPFPSLNPQQDTASLRFGGEYWLHFGRIGLPLRLGAFEEDRLAAPYPRFSLDYPRATGFSLGSGVLFAFAGAEIELDLTWLRSEASLDDRQRDLDDLGRVRFDVESAYRSTSERFLSSLTVRF